MQNPCKKMHTSRILWFSLYKPIVKYRWKLLISGIFGMFFSEEKKLSQKLCYQLPPKVDRLFHTYRGLIDQLLGIQMFVVLEIICFSSETWYFFSRLNEWKNLGNPFEFPKNTFLSYSYTHRPGITGVYPPVKHIFFRKTIFIWFFGRKIEKSDPFGTGKPSESFGHGKSCVWSWPQRIWFLYGLWVLLPG